MRKTFKKLLSVALASTMVVGLAGCGNSATTNGGSDSTADKSGKTYTIGICQQVPLTEIHIISVSASLYSTRLLTLLQTASRRL